MATHTLATSANLTAVTFSPSQVTLLPADLGAVANLIKFDSSAGQFARSAFTREGDLFLPGRGVLAIRPGDVIAVDANGWPILVSGYSIATGGWTFT
jgi:hypothetical protein